MRCSWWRRLQAAGGFETACRSSPGLATNAVLHGGGHGSIELRLVNDELRCEVMDGGPGLPERSAMPAQGQAHGLRLAEALTGRLELHSGPDQRGTVAALAVRVRS